MLYFLSYVKRKPGGDCNNRSIYFASALKAAGHRVAFVYAENDPNKTAEIARDMPQYRFLSHLKIMALEEVR